jgi:hypothetical protein
VAPFAATSTGARRSDHRTIPAYTNTARTAVARPRTRLRSAFLYRADGLAADESDRRDGHELLQQSHDDSFARTRDQSVAATEKTLWIR